MENIIPIKKESGAIRGVAKISKDTDILVKLFKNVFAPFVVEEEKVQKENIKKIKKENKIIEQQEKLSSFQLFNERIQKKYTKYKTNTLKFWEKLRQKKWFDKVLGGLKGLAEKGSNWFFDLLKMLMILSLFPGLADMFFSIINTIIQFAIRLLIKYLPIVIKELGRIINEVLPKFISQVGHGILDAFNIPKDSPLRKIIDFLSSNAPIFFVIWGILSALVKFAPVILLLFKVFGFIAMVVKWVWIVFIGLFKFLSFIVWVIGFIASVPAWLVALIIGAIIALGIVIYKFRDQILNFIKQIPQWIVGLAKKVGILFNKLWVNVKKYFNTFTNFIKKWMKKFFDFLFYPFKKLWNTLKGLFSKISDSISFDAIKKNLKNAIKNLPDNLLSAFGNLKNAISLKIDDIKTAFLEMLSNITAQMVAFAKSPLDKKARKWDVAQSFIASSGGFESLGITEEMWRKFVSNPNTRMSDTSTTPQQKKIMNEVLGKMGSLVDDNRKSMQDVVNAILETKEKYRTVIQKVERKKKITHYGK